MGTGLPPAGWHDDPEDATQLRWWDGERWTEHRHPKPGRSPQSTTAVGSSATGSGGALAGSSLAGTSLGAGSLASGSFAGSSLAGSSLAGASLGGGTWQRAGGTTSANGDHGRAAGWNGAGSVGMGGNTTGRPGGLRGTAPTAEPAHVRGRRAEAIRKVESIARLVQLLLGGYGAVTLLAVAGALWTRSVLVARGLSAASGPAGLADMASLAQLGMLVVTGVVWLVWISRAHGVVADHGTAAVRHSSTWSVASWIVPIANLWVPKQVIDDLWTGSASGRHDATVPPLVHTWWALWVGSSFLGRLIVTLPDTTERFAWAGYYRNLAFLGMVELVLAVMAVLVVRGLTERISALR